MCLSEFVHLYVQIVFCDAIIYLIRDLFIPLFGKLKVTCNLYIGTNFYTMQAEKFYFWQDFILRQIIKLAYYKCYVKDQLIFSNSDIFIFLCAIII